ncbi:hypothetical protein [Streptomyces sp. NPDC058683]|uniref:hypothetical protein n=1 Tax=Streptomyces sp. NPDC058683 TaxID=3346597 RepID=UPI003656BA9C
MRSRIWPLVLTVIALIGPGAMAPPASASAAGSGVEFVYSAPEISEQGDTVTWDWTVTNRGDAGIRNIVMTHTITPKLTVTQASAGCEIGAAATKCRYGNMAAGGKVTGTLVARLPDEVSGNVEIRGRLTWESSSPDASR